MYLRVRIYYVHISSWEYYSKTWVELSSLRGRYSVVYFLPTRCISIKGNSNILSWGLYQGCKYMDDQQPIETKWWQNRTDCDHHTRTRPLRSDNKILLRVTRCRLEGFGRRCFAYAAPSLWNPLPTPVKHSSSMNTLKSSLKTYLFNVADPSIHWLLYCMSKFFVTLSVFSTYERFWA